MSPDTLIVVIGGIVAALLGALALPLWNYAKDRRSRTRQLHKFGYAKIYHLSLKSADPKSSFQRYIPRLEKHIDVFDEYHFFRLSIFRDPQKEFTIQDRSSGTVDMQIIHPWQELFFPDKGAAQVESVLSQTFQQSSNVFFSKTVYYNALQPGHTDFAIKMERDTEEARLMIDFTALPGFEKFITAMPRGIFRNSRGEEESIGVVSGQHQPGTFIVSRKNLKKEEVIGIEFAFDWDIIEQNKHPVKVAN